VDPSPGFDLRVFYSIGGTAINGTDYEQLAGSVLIPAGSTWASVYIEPVDDRVFEGQETVVLTLKSAQGYSVGSPDSGTVAIADDDALGPWGQQAAADFNGDGKADVLLQNTTQSPGIVYTYLMDGKTIAAEGVIRRISNDWRVERVADFNGDGKSDILLRNTATNPNLLYIYTMDGKSIASEGVVRGISPDWEVKQVADFNGDGKADILLRNTAVSPGILYLYTMNGKRIAAEGVIRRISNDWRIVSVADFSGDGKADILLRNSSTSPTILYMYQMNGRSIASEGVVRRISSDWEVRQVADFDGDAKADILLRNTAMNPGSLYLYMMDGKAIHSEGMIRSLSSGWRVGHADDFNGDGMADILLRNINVTPSILYLYAMNGKAIASEGVVRRIQSDWKAGMVADFNGDSRADVLLRNSTDPGALYLYTMDGKTITKEGVLRYLNSAWMLAGTR
jgi:hypothetical protein